MKAAKPSSVYVREFRERMRRAGLIKKDVWILPGYAADLATIEKRFRQVPGEAGTDPLAQGGAWPSVDGWTLGALQSAIEASPLVQVGSVDVARIEGADPALSLVMRDHGDLPVFLVVGALQIVVQALLWPVDHVRDPAAFNAYVLGTHKFVPLSNVGVESVAGVPCYILFGSLDTQSSLTNILFEIQTLADNVIASVDAYRSFLKDEVLMQAGLSA
ncbi:hypothetical protein N800_05710 [Lysobacter daejeonensis GH1-9]|uniref:DUF2170 family protein n=1 Tax=Lysobacter daejeonensis GH1-9 TaxID=1385517 RepID=A0A0A0EU60_9GAMM|nr:YjfI family protein [Lysobacter daejeonensis]KGM54069.1 hypothetical protein N800_05710 [Lysobacter daejeonensis GH1-9]